MDDTLTNDQIQSLIDQWERFAKAYFWSPPTHASARRSYESRNSIDIDGVFAGKKITASVMVDCSCKNIYVTRRLEIDGERKKITAIKKLVGSK